MTASIHEGKSRGFLSPDKDISSYSFSSSLLDDDSKQNLQINNKDDNDDNNNQADNIIKSLDIAEGLKELLILHGFTIELLLATSATELANTLGIDQYVAIIICQSANRIVSGIHSR